MHLKADGPRVALAILGSALALTGVGLAAAPAHADCRVEYDCHPEDGPGPIGGGGVPQDVLTGTFRYQDSNGDRPIAGATVEVWTEEPRDPFGIIRYWDKAYTRRTSSDGSLRVSVAHKPGVNVKYALRVFASNDAAIVMPGTAVNVTPYYVEPPGPDGSPHYVAKAAGTADFTTTFRDGASTGRFNIADAMRHGQNYAAASRAAGETDDLPPVTVRIDAAANHHESWLWWEGIKISTDRMFDDWVALHEFGHHVQHRLGVIGDGGGAHDGCAFEAGSTKTRAFQEAWASAFANATVFRNPGALDSNWGSESAPDCDLPAGTPGDTVERYVWGALWDLLDANNEAGDSFTRTDLVGGATLERLLVEIVDRELDAPDQGMLDFRRALIDRGIDQVRLDELLRHNRVLSPLPPPPPPPPPADPVEPPDETPLPCRAKPWMCD
jgi:hypothetical protein